MLKKILLAFAAPKHQVANDSGDLDKLDQQEAATPQRMGEAFCFCELIESFRTEDAPRSGGTSATAVIHLDLDTLLGGLKPAHLDTGEPISPDQARRMACEAGIIPVVLTGGSQVLDLGRTRRFHSRSQRIATGIEHPECQAANCDWPSGMCHRHHLDPWHQGGGTDLKNTAVLCPRHHTLIHHHDYGHERRPTAPSLSIAARSGTSTCSWVSRQDFVLPQPPGPTGLRPSSTTGTDRTSSFLNHRGYPR